MRTHPKQVDFSWNIGNNRVQNLNFFVLNSMKNHRNIFLFLSFLAWVSRASGAVALIGGSISWSLSDDFESSRRVFFVLRTAWDQTTFFMPSMRLTIGQTVQFPTNTNNELSVAGSFGVLKIMAGQQTWLFANEYTVMSFDGDANIAPSLVEGELAVNITLPEGVLSANASIVQQSGQPFSRQPSGTSTLPQYISGGMAPCNPIGPSSTPCQEGVYLSVANMAQIDLFATLQLPPNATYYWNRNSPLTAARPIVQLSQLCFSQTGAAGCFTDPLLQASFQFPLFDLDGDTVRLYTDGTTRDGPGTQTLFCGTRRVMTVDGCNGPGSALDGPPYAAPTLGFNESFTRSIPRDNPKFYYSLAFKATDGTNLVTHELQINLCKPLLTVQVGTGTALGRAPEFVTTDARGVVLRAAPPTTVLCRRTERCAFTVRAATFAAAVGTAAAAGVVTRIALAGYGGGGRLLNQTVGPDGVASATFLVGGDGANGTHGVGDIGRYRAPCFLASSNTACRSAPLCVLVKVLGSDPVFLPPTPPLVAAGDDLQPGVVATTPVCDGLTVSFGFRATDPDPDDAVTIEVTDATGDGLDLFRPPFGAVLARDAAADPHTPAARFSYTLDYASGVRQDPVTRAVDFPDDRLVCAVAVDDTRRRRRRFGALPDGNFRGPTKCYRIAFAGPPAFLTTASRRDATPFAALNGPLAARTRVLDFFYGAPRTVTFRARSPTAANRVTVFVLEDPGIPDGATVGPSVCEPAVVPRAGFPAGYLSNCSVASRVVSWAPPAGLDFARVYRVCAVARDDVLLPQCLTPRMTVEGWYGEEQCVAIRLVPPALSWTANSSVGGAAAGGAVAAGGEGLQVLHAFVPCSTVFVLEAMDNSTVVDSNGTLLLSPYQIAIEFVGAAPQRASLRAVVTGGRLARSELVYSAARGDEGRRETVCVTARDSAGAILALPPACAVVIVRRCIYCVGPADTLETVMMAVGADLNWLRLWAANGNDDGDPDTATVTDPGSLVAPGGGPVRINLGALYEAEAGDTLQDLAARFQTTVRLLLSLNPDVGLAAGGSIPRLVVGQELCVIPCSGEDDPDLVAA